MDCQKINDWVLEQIQPHMSLLNIIERGKLKYCRHILRTDSGLKKSDYAEKGGREKKKGKTEKEMAR